MISLNTQPGKRVRCIRRSRHLEMFGVMYGHEYVLSDWLSNRRRFFMKGMEALLFCPEDFENVREENAQSEHDAG